jgi:hypothetical protein
MTQIDSLHPDAALHCPECGYSLFGIQSAVCPECGVAIDRTNLGVSRIPWTHRQKIGRASAFLRTSWLAMRHPKRLAQEINRPVSFEDARKFRRVCMLMVLIPLAVAAPIVFSQIDGMRVWERIAGAASVCVGGWLYVAVIMGWPSMFFHPRAIPILRQNRAIAISYYSAAPLAWSAIPVAIFGLAIWLDNTTSNSGYWKLILLGYGFSIAMILAEFFALATTVTSLLKHAIGAILLKRWAVFVAQLFLALVLGYVFMLGIPLIALFIAIVIKSLRGL